MLPPSFFQARAPELAKALLGMWLVRFAATDEQRPGWKPLLVGRIVETEAYRQDDPASHSFNGPTPRTKVMFSEGGLAYVYLIYGMHHCMNVVAEPQGTGAAVLIRAVKPILGLPEMWASRFGDRPVAANDARRVRALCNGPGKLAQAFGITVERDNAHDLCKGSLRILQPHGYELTAEHELVESPRIGISRATDLNWRFYAKRDAYWVSGSKISTTRSRSSIER
ncbi:MAG: DNA-3-methyladenine glycosylase [Spirochaetaceae bacterium]|nr:MAG: DNA-3-methyladenine glycosylase [Spirochaetaceae bacterium]